MITLVPISSPAPLALVTTAEMVQLVAHGLRSDRRLLPKEYALRRSGWSGHASLLAPQHAHETRIPIHSVMYLTDRLPQWGPNREIVGSGVDEDGPAEAHSRH